jgi:hypothetical protein
MRLVAPLIVDYYASRRLVVVDYFASAARPGASARCAARHAAYRAARRRLLQARRRLLLLCRASGCLGTCGSSRGSSSTTSPAPRIWVPRHVARLVMRLVAPLVVVDYSASRRLVVDYSTLPRLVVDHSVRRDFVLRPRWLYFSHAVRGDYLSRGNTGSTSSTPHAATTSLPVASR